jgi:K+-sensing histidine kinase KdpD
VVRVEGDDLAAVVAALARARGATHVVIAHRPQTRFERLRRVPLADVLMEALPGMELHIVGPGRRG